MRSARHRFTALTTAAVMAGSLLAVSAAATVFAATPANGTISTTAKSVHWTGNTYAGAGPGSGNPALCEPMLDPASTSCDHYFLTVNIPASYWTTRDGGVEVTANWASQSDDFDMYIFDKDGEQVASSTFTQGTTNYERTTIPEPNSAKSPYEIRLVPFLVASVGGTNYKGTAGLVTRPQAAPATLPNHTPGGLAFAPSVVVDPQRTEGEPVNFIDPRNGAYWETGPWGASTNQSFVHRSVDGGNQFNLVSPIIQGTRPNEPPGGGDSDVVTDDQGVSYFTDLEALAGIDASVSNDNGNRWRKNPAANAVTATTIDDRQWIAVDNGTNKTAGTPQNPNPAGAADNTIFLSWRQTPLGSFLVSTPGSTGPTDPVGGLVYDNAVEGGGPIATGGAPCGQMKFEPVRRNLYLVCGQGTHVQVSVARVAVGQRTGLVFKDWDTPESPGGGETSDVFPILTTDAAGNVYVVWVDEQDHQIYYTSTTDNLATTTKTAAQVWKPVRKVNGNPSWSNTFPWAAAGANGTLVVGWLGSTSKIGGNDMPSWYNDRIAATAFPWYGYVSVIRNATSTSPTFNQVRFTRKPMHYGQICNAGTFCLATGGDRVMADYFAFTLDRDGTIRVVYNDTTSQHHGAHLFEARQLRGPTGANTYVNRAFPANPMADRTGDAQWPHYAITGPGPNKGALDFTKLELSRLNQSTLRVRMTVKDPLSTATPPSGEATSLWLARFQALSIGDGGEPSYRIFYVGAEKEGAGAPTTFFGGSGESAQGPVQGNGCVNTTPETCKIVLYPPETTLGGTASGNVITIDVPVQTGFGAGRPINGDILYNVTAFSLGRGGVGVPIGQPIALPIDPLYADVDATRAFDFSLRTNTAVGAPEDPVVLLTKSGPTTATRGAEITYRVSYRNLGPSASQGAKIVDTLPANVRFVSATRSGTYNATTRKVTWNLGTVAARTTGYVDVKVRVSSTVPAGTVLTNQANFTGLLTISPPTATAKTVVR